MTLSDRVRAYLRFHWMMLGLALCFAVWALAMRYFFPNGYYDCLLNDVLHLYCPLCGGTRAFLSVLRLRLFDAWQQNAALMLAIPVVLALEVRALLLLLRRREGELLPRCLRVPLIAYLVLWALLRNTLMLFGVDPLGDNAAYWQLRLTAWRAALFLPLSLLLCIAFWLAVTPSPGRPRLRMAAILTAALLPAAILALLHGRWLILLSEVPILLTVSVIYGLKRKKHKEKNNASVSDLFGK